MIIWLASYPRSGNTFFRVALRYLYGCKPNCIYQMGGEGTGSLGVLDCKVATDLSIEELEADEEIHFVKTHDLWQPQYRRAIYLLRDGREALVSYAHFLQSRFNHQVDKPEFETGLRNLILEENSPFGTWSSNVASWEQCPQMTLVRFEDFTKRPLACLDEALKNLGVSIDRVSADVPPFQELHQLAPDFFRKGRVGEWQDEFPADLLDLFHEKSREQLVRYGYLSE